MRRAEIERMLHESRVKTLAFYVGLDDTDLRRPRTLSEHDPASTWSALDHLSHLGYIEETFVAMIRRHLTGTANPVGLLLDNEGNTRSRDEVIAGVHERTEADQRAHQGHTLSDAVRRTGAARAASLALLSELSDEQLDEPVPGAPWADGTIGGVLSANAGHATMHWQWVTEVNEVPTS
jgi:hypothetical protein